MDPANRGSLGREELSSIGRDGNIDGVEEDRRPTGKLEGGFGAVGSNRTANRSAGSFDQDGP